VAPPATAALLPCANLECEGGHDAAHCFDAANLGTSARSEDHRVSNEQGSSHGSKRMLWVVLALVIVVGAGAVAIVLANRGDSGVTNGHADAISITITTTTTTTAVVDGTQRSTTSINATSTAATTSVPTDAPATTNVPATTVKAPTTTPPKPAAAPTLAVTSVASNYPTYPCSASPQLTLQWSTTLADSVTIGIDNPGAFEQNLPASGSLDVPFTGCTNGNGKVTYYVIAKRSNGDQITRTIVVTAGA
jgi:hypothetical protein